MWYRFFSDLTFSLLIPSTLQNFTYFVHVGQILTLHIDRVFWIGLCEYFQSHFLHISVILWSYCKAFIGSLLEQKECAGARYSVIMGNGLGLERLRNFRTCGLWVQWLSQNWYPFPFYRENTANITVNGLNKIVIEGLEDKYKVKGKPVRGEIWPGLMGLEMPPGGTGYSFYRGSSFLYMKIALHW